MTVGQALLEDGLVKRLRPILPDLDPSSLANGGATSLRNMVSAEQLPLVLEAYNASIKSIWYLALGLGCLVFVVSWGMEWKNVKPQKSKSKSGDEEAAEADTDAMEKANTEVQASKDG